MTIMAGILVAGRQGAGAVAESSQNLVLVALCDLGRVASEPPVPGHDHEEDVDVGSVGSRDSCVSLASSESAGHYLRWTDPRPCSWCGYV